MSQAQKDNKHRRNGRAQTFRLGEGPLVLRVYDKCAEIDESRSAVSNWRAGVKAPDDDLVIGLAKLIDRDLREVMAFCASKRAKTEEARKEWESIGLGWRGPKVKRADP